MYQTLAAGIAPRQGAAEQAALAPKGADHDPRPEQNADHNPQQVQQDAAGQVALVQVQGVRQVGVRVDVAAHVEAHQADVVEQEAEVPRQPATSASTPRGSAKPGLQRPRATSGQARGSEAELL